MFSTDEYREVLGDTVSTDEQIAERLQYLRAFLRSLVRSTLQQVKANVQEARKKIANDPKTK